MTQITNGLSSRAKAEGGQATNLVKFRRYAALTSYSSEGVSDTAFSWARAGGTAPSAAPAVIATSASLSTSLSPLLATGVMEERRLFAIP